MSNVEDNFENLSTTLRFNNHKKTKTASAKQYPGVPNYLFLNKPRETLETALFDLPENNIKPGEVLVKKNEETDIPAFGRKRNSMLMVKERQFLPYLAEEEEKPTEPVIKKSTVGRKRKNKDAFDFGVNITKEQKEMKKEAKMENEAKVEKKVKKKEEKVMEGEEFEEEVRGMGTMDEEHRLKIKTNKVEQYWKKQIIMIPNALRLCHLLDDDDKNLLEFQDYSKKEVLVQGNGSKREAVEQAKLQKQRGGDKRKMSIFERRSFMLNLTHPDDLQRILDDSL